MTLSKQREDFSVICCVARFNPRMKQNWYFIKYFNLLVKIGNMIDQVDFSTRIICVNYVNPIISIFLCHIYWVDRVTESKGGEAG